MKPELIQSPSRASAADTEPTPKLSRAIVEHYARRAHRLRSAAMGRAAKSAVAALAAGFEAIFQAFKRSRDRRKAIGELSRLNARTLKDIGIERSQIPIIVEQLLERRKADGVAEKAYPLRLLTSAPAQPAADDDECCPPLAA